MNNLRFEKRGERIGVLTFHRPEALNALNRETVRELYDFLAVFPKDEIDLLILTGSGDRAFIAGADIKEMREMGVEEARQFSILGQEALLLLERLPVVTLAAVNGFALGGGTEVAMACDLIYASDRAVFGQPEVALGILPGFGGTQRAVKLLGKLRAKELIFSGKRVKAEAAKEMGLVNEIFPSEGFLDRVLTEANAIAANGMYAVRRCKQLIEAAVSTDLERGLAFEQSAFALCFTTDDHREGLAAFVEKRKPQFTGN